ncbi:MAG: ABC transporter substrate-binding protein [Holophagales bacterium]|nr:ABC transporter substrate-binding protein [Holophagales bacterium]
MRISPGPLHGLALALLVATMPVATVAAGPQRVVALAPSAAEIIYALGAAERVVGVSDFAADLAESKGKARLGGFSPDLERIAALRPDLAVVSRDGTDRRAADRLASLGIRVVVTDADSLAGVFEDIRTVGEALGTTVAADRLVSSLERRAGAAEARSRARKGSERPSALALIWPDPPVVAGPATFIGDLLQRAGVDNVVPRSAGQWPRVSHETLVSWGPRVLVRPETIENGAAFKAAFAPGSRWHLLPAVRDGRVVILPGAWLERPGPRLVDALEALVEKLRELGP